MCSTHFSGLPNWQKCFVKLRAGMSGKYSLLSEWLGNRLGHMLGIKTQTPVWVELTADVAMDGIHVEVRDLIMKSLGTNIGFKFQEDLQDFTPGDLNQCAKNELNELFLLDLILINVDRSLENLNLVRARDEFFSIDYESSLLFQDLIERSNLLQNDRILQGLKTNPLYANIQSSTLKKFQQKLNAIAFEKILSEIPSELMSTEMKLNFIDGIKDRKRNDWHLEETMKKLTTLEVESLEARAERIKKNQEAFRRRFLKNSDSAEQ